MKKTYKMIYTEIIVHHFYADAENEDAALEEFHRLNEEGKLDFSDGEIVDTDTVVELDDSNRGCYIPTQPRSAIDKVLTISSFHVSPDTSEKLDKLDTEPAFPHIDLSVYPKADFGWWICIDPCIVKDDGTRRIPDDLMDCIRFAWKHDCTWLCFDCDGEIIPELKTYDWEN